MDIHYVVYLLISLVSVFILLIPLVHYTVYFRTFRSFKVNPFLYKLVSGDAVNNGKPLVYETTNYVISGRPDALFRHRYLFYKFILCDFKSGYCSGDRPRKMDFFQMIIYQSILSSGANSLSSINIKLRYSNVFFEFPVKKSSRKIVFSILNQIASNKCYEKCSIINPLKSLDVFYDKTIFKT